MLVLGPLARQPEPFTYDLCRDHADKLTPPQGWQVVRLTTRYDDVPLSAADPEALLKAMKEPLPPVHVPGPGEDSAEAKEHSPLGAPAQAKEPDFTAQVINLPLRKQENAPQQTAPHNEAPATRSVEYGPFTAGDSAKEDSAGDTSGDSSQGDE